MSVDRYSDPASPLLRVLGRASEDCSFCGRPLADPVVTWSLALDPVLSLHPECAEKLGGNLIYDARRAEYIARGQSLLAGIDHVWRKLAATEPR